MASYVCTLEIIDAGSMLTTNKPYTYLVVCQVRVSIPEGSPLRSFDHGRKAFVKVEKRCLTDGYSGLILDPFTGQVYRWISTDGRIMHVLRQHPEDPASWWNQRIKNKK